MKMIGALILLWTCGGSSYASVILVDKDENTSKLVKIDLHVIKFFQQKRVRSIKIKGSCPKIELSPNPQHHRCSTTFAAVHLHYRCTTTLASPLFTFTVVAPPLFSPLTFTIVAPPVLPLFTFTIVGPPPSPPFHHHTAGCGFTVDVIQSMLIIYIVCRLFRVDDKFLTVTKFPILTNEVSVKGSHLDVDCCGYNQVDEEVILYCKA
nr:hypothetical protein [Tanacetum cinerariifolium]